jgi:hypothetical protein
MRMIHSARPPRIPGVLCVESVFQRQEDSDTFAIPFEPGFSVAKMSCSHKR